MCRPPKVSPHTAKERKLRRHGKQMAFYDLYIQTTLLPKRKNRL